MRSRDVNARARRTALIAASVPDETSRTFSTDGTASTISAASSTSDSVGAPKLVPRSAASRTASTVSGSAWPNTSGPHDMTQSRYLLPSTSSRYAPRARRTKKGSSSPTARIARTGELTPPGISSSARRNKSLRVRRTRVPNSLFISPGEAKGLPQPSENAKHPSGSSEPGCELLGPVGDDEVCTGTLDRGQRLERRRSLVEEPLRGRRLHHRVLPRDVVGTEWPG